VQAFGKVPIDLSATPVDLLTVSAHKIGGPKGTGALYVAEDIELEPIVYGGGQESGLRSGTQDLAAIVGFAVAAERVVAELGTEPERWRALRDRLESALRHALPGLAVNAGDAPERLPNVLNVSIPAVDIEALITSFDLEGICVSTGSACTTGSVEPSHVLVAMGRQGELARNTVRISLGHDSRAAEIDRVIEVFPAMVDRVRRFAPTA
jgi:cysteine desulfurase